MTCFLATGSVLNICGFVVTPLSLSQSFKLSTTVDKTVTFEVSLALENPLWFSKHSRVILVSFSSLKTLVSPLKRPLFRALSEEFRLPRLPRDSGQRTRICLISLCRSLLGKIVRGVALHIGQGLPSFRSRAIHARQKCRPQHSVR